MLARPQNLLTDLEIALLNDARNYVMNAIKVRSTAPSSFESNIAFLGEQMKGIKLWMEVVKPHMEAKFTAEQSKDTCCFSFFSKPRHVKILEETKIYEDSKKYVFDDHYMVKVKEEISKDPRIADLSSNIKFKDSETTDFKSKKLLSHTHKEIETYTITFSDNSTIELHDLESASLTKAKLEFDDKMKCLEQKNSNTLRLS